MSAIEQHRPISALSVTPQKLCRSARTFTARNNSVAAPRCPVGSLVGVGCRVMVSDQVWAHHRHTRADANVCLLKDLEAIQKRALAEGLPYQTLISSLLHKYGSGRLKEI